MFRPHPVVWNPESVKNFWDFYSNHKDSEDLYFSKRFGGYVVDQIKKRISLNGLNVLDYGSGPGFMLKHYEQRRLRINYFALDFSAGTIRALRETLKGHPLFNEAFTGHEIQRVSDLKFDMIVSCEVIEHLGDDELPDIMNLCRSKLLPGGHLVLTTPNNEYLGASACICPECGCIFHVSQHVRVWSRDTLKRFLTDQGFRDIDVFRTWFGNRLVKIYYQLRGVIWKDYRNSSLFCVARIP